MREKLQLHTQLLLELDALRATNQELSAEIDALKRTANEVENEENARETVGSNTEEFGLGLGVA